MTRPPDQQPPAEPPSHREVLALLRRHLGPVQVLEVRPNTVAGVRRRQQTTRPWRLPL